VPWQARNQHVVAAFVKPRTQIAELDGAGGDAVQEDDRPACCVTVVEKDGVTLWVDPRIGELACLEGTDAVGSLVEAGCQGGLRLALPRTSDRGLGGRVGWVHRERSGAFLAYAWIGELA
jgi:hypothetical protein